MGEELLVRIDDVGHRVGIETHPHGEDVELIVLADLLQEFLVSVPDLGVVPGKHGPLPQLEVVHAL